MTAILNNNNIMTGPRSEKMKGIESLVEKAINYKEKGLKEKEIATELNVSPDTVNWLLTRHLKKTEKPPVDVKIGWESVGLYGGRIGMLSSLMSDIIMEEMERLDTDFDTVVGVSINGVPPAVLISQQLDRELALYRPPQDDREHGGGSLCSNYADVDGKKVVIVDDVLSTGETMSGAVTDMEEHGGEALLCTVFVDKDGAEDIYGVPLRSLFHAKVIS